MHDRERTPTPLLAALALLTLAALALRLVGIGCGLPHHLEPDSLLVSHAAWFARPEGTLASPLAAPLTFYPRFLPWLVSVLPGASYPLAPAPDAGLAAHLAALAGPFLKARIVIACLSVLAIPATFCLARRFLEPSWSFVAALLCATSLLATNYAQQARPHAAMAGLIGLGLVGVLRLVEGGSWASYLLAAAGTALAVAGLHNGGAVLLALVAAQLLAPRRSWPRFALALALVALAARFAYGTLFEGGLQPGETGGLSLGGQELSWRMFDGSGFGQIAAALWGYEPVMSVLLVALLGAWLARRGRVARERRAALGVLLACFVPFLLVWGMRQTVAARFLVPFVPALALGAAGGLRLLLRGRLAPGLRAALVLLVLLPQTWASVKLVVLRARGETLAEAARWLEAHADREHDAIGLQAAFALPLFTRRADLEALPRRFRSTWEHYQLALPAEPPGAWDLRCIQRAEWWTARHFPAEGVAEFAAEEGLRWGLGVVPTAKARGYDETADGLRRVGELVLRLHPFDLAHPELSASAYELGFRGFERVLRSERWGSPVELYRMK